MRTPTQAQEYKYTLAHFSLKINRTATGKCKCTEKHTNAQMYTHACTHARAHAHTHTHTHTHVHTHTYTHTHTHTHTHNKHNKKFHSTDVYLCFPFSLHTSRQIQKNAIFRSVHALLESSMCLCVKCSCPIWVQHVSLCVKCSCPV